MQNTGIIGVGSISRRHLEAFIAAIEQNTTPPVTPEYARDLVRTLIACEESAQTGREVVIG